jgi:oligopeptide/dipeptide ABC transporter ATP-binding protein
VIESAAAPELYGNPRHPYTLGLMKSVPRLDQVRRERLDPIEGMPPDLIHQDAGCPFRPRCRFAVDRCKESNPPLVSVGEMHMAACFEWERVRKGGGETTVAA